MFTYEQFQEFEDSLTEAQKFNRTMSEDKLKEYCGKFTSGIYMITNPDGVKYVGQSIKIEIRWLNYYRVGAQTNDELYKSFKAFGVSNHKFEILAKVPKEKLDERERFYQEFHKVIKNGHNKVLQHHEGNSGLGLGKKKKDFSIYINGKEFKTKKELKDYMTLIRNHYVINKPIVGSEYYEFVTEFFKAAHKDNFKPFRRLWVATDEYGMNFAFWVEYDDNTRNCISYYKALLLLY